MALDNSNTFFARKVRSTRIDVLSIESTASYSSFSSSSSSTKDAETKRMSDADTTHNKIVSKHEQRVANAKSEILPKTKEVQVRKEALDKRQAELDDEAVVVKADQKSVDERHHCLLVKAPPHPVEALW